MSTDARPSTRPAPSVEIETDSLPPAPARDPTPTPEQKRKLAARTNAYVRAVADAYGLAADAGFAPDGDQEAGASAVPVNFSATVEVEGSHTDEHSAMSAYMTPRVAPEHPIYEDLANGDVEGVTGEQFREALTAWEVTLTVVWDAYVCFGGWSDEFTAGLRHEFAHILDVQRHPRVLLASHTASTHEEMIEVMHGETFDRIAAAVDAAGQHAGYVDAREHRLMLRCGEGCSWGRSQAREWVRDPGRCTHHGESITATHLATERAWTSRAEYEQVRATIEETPGEAW